MEREFFFPTLYFNQTAYIWQWLFHFPRKNELQLLWSWKNTRNSENRLHLLRHSAMIGKLFSQTKKQGGASVNGKVSVLRQGRVLRHSGEPLSQTLQSHLETQCEARQGHRGRFSETCLRMHPLPPQRQGHPRCVNCINCTEQGPPRKKAGLFRGSGRSSGQFLFMGDFTNFSGDMQQLAQTLNTKSKKI